MYDVFAMSIFEASRTVRHRADHPGSTLPPRGGETSARPGRTNGGLPGRRPRRDG
ncbi:hypothetical protein [Minwuia thermotolerans]|uniref:hypothetical protein n=1 Tax=Minwuia thermotolerans TaxID=2056226 RepID=UPI0013DD9466|nr:hypothetical protein [Minwuia thermotolerans]